MVFTSRQKENRLLVILVLDFPFLTTKIFSEERYISEHEKILDLMAIVDIKRFKNKFEKIEQKFYLKLRVFYPKSKFDIRTFNYFYTQVSALFTSNYSSNILQILYDVCNHRIPVNREQGLKLAALAFQIQFGDFNNHKENLIKYNILSTIDNLIDHYFRTHRNQFIPKSLYFLDTLEEANMQNDTTYINE